MLAKIFNGAYLKRLDNIKQWQEMDVFKEESVSQHSYKVSIFGRILLEDIFGFDNEDAKVLAFKLDCVDAFAFHDWDEALILRDMSHETKYNNYNGTEIRTALNNLSKHKAIEEFGEEDESGSGNWTASANMVVDNITRSGDDVKIFCKLADWLALAFYMKRERELGNKSLSAQWERGRAGLEQAVTNVIEMLNRKFGGHVIMNFSELNNLIKNVYGEQ